MKTLPVLTLTLTLTAIGGYAVQTGLIGSAFGQDAPEKPAVAEADAASKPADVESDEATPEGSSKATLRRNEQSGANALLTLQQAHDKLNGYRFIDAKLDQSIRVGDRQFRMSGRYLKGADLKLRLEYDVQVGGTSGKLIEVCDGQLLWTHTDVGGQQRVTRRNVQQIISAASQAGFSSQNVLTAELGLGGLQGLLASLQKSIQFDAQWEQDASDRVFVVIEGAWKRSFRERFLGANAPADRPLPPAVPDQVRLYFEQDSLFPRRIVYLKKEGDDRRLPMVTIDFTEVTWPESLDDALFTFKPPATVAPEDITKAYVNQFQPEPVKPADGAASASSGE
jgi:outer membrane lipoprotein-sorting protein